MLRKKILILTFLFIFITVPGMRVFAEDAYQIFDEGVSFFDQGDYESALAAFKGALEKKEDFAEAYYNLGIIYDIQKRFSEAIDAYKHVIQIDPNVGKVLENLVLDSYLVGDIQGAVYYAKLAEYEANPINSMLYNQTVGEYLKGRTAPSFLDTGQLQRLKMDLDSEITHLEEKLKQKGQPQSKDLLELGIKNRQRGNIDKAIEILKRAADADPNHYMIHAELSLCYFLDGQTDLFDKHFRMARELGYTPSLSVFDLHSQSVSNE